MAQQQQPVPALDPRAVKELEARFDPFCLSVADLATVLPASHSAAHAGFALETLRNALAQRSGANSEVLAREYVLFRANAAPTSRLQLADIRRKPPTQQQQHEAAMATAHQQQQQMQQHGGSFSFWESLCRAGPLVGTVASPVSLLEAFSIARFGDVAHVPDIYAAVCDKFAVRDGEEELRQAGDVSALPPLPPLDISAINRNAKQDASAVNSMWSPAHNRSGTAAAAAAPDDLAANANSSTMAAFARGEMSVALFTPKSKKKLPLARLLKHLARIYDCHIVTPVRVSLEDPDDLILHFAPQQQQQQQQTPVRIVVLRPVGDLVVRRMSRPTEPESGIFVWSCNNPTWHCAFLSERPATAALLAALLPKQQQRGDEEAGRRGDRRGQQVPGVVDSPSASSSSSSSDETPSSDDDDDDDDDDSSSSSSSGSGSSGEEELDDSADTQADDRQRLQETSMRLEYSAAADRRWTTQQPYRSKFVPSFFEQQQQAYLQRLQREHNQRFGGALVPGMQQQQSLFGYQQQASGALAAGGGAGPAPIATLAGTSSRDFIVSDDVDGGEGRAQAPPLANIAYPTVESGIGLGLLLKATVGSDSPLFARMRTRLFALMAVLLLIVVFCSAYLGVVSPSFGICCVDPNDAITSNVSIMTAAPAPTTTVAAIGSTTSAAAAATVRVPLSIGRSAPREILLEYAKLFCPARRTVFQQLADALTTPPAPSSSGTGTTTTTTTTTTTKLSTLDGNATMLACAQRVCARTESMRDDAVYAAKFGDGAGGPAETAWSFLFAAVGPAVSVFVLALLLMLFEVLLAFFVARRLATKAQGIFATVFWVFCVLVFLCVVGEAAALVAHVNEYHADTAAGPMSRRVDCDQLSEPASRQVCHMGADCGVELRTRMELESDSAPMGLAATLLVLAVAGLVASAALSPFPTEEDQAKILPSKPSTLIFSPGRAVPDGLPLERVVRIQHKIDRKLQARIHHDVRQAAVQAVMTKAQRVYGERPAQGLPSKREVSRQLEIMEKRHAQQTGAGGKPDAAAAAAAAAPAAATNLPKRPASSAAAVLKSSQLLAEAEKQRQAAEAERIAARRAKFALAPPPPPNPKHARPIKVFTTPERARTAEEEQDDRELMSPGKPAHGGDGADPQKEQPRSGLGDVASEALRRERRSKGGKVDAMPPDVRELISSIVRRVRAQRSGTGGADAVVKDAYASEQQQQQRRQ